MSDTKSPDKAHRPHRHRHGTPPRESSLLYESDDSFSQQIAQLTSMGFEVAECHTALDEAHGDIQRALEMLLSGSVAPPLLQTANSYASLPSDVYMEYYPADFIPPWSLHFSNTDDTSQPSQTNLLAVAGALDLSTDIAGTGKEIESLSDERAKLLIEKLSENTTFIQLALSAQECKDKKALLQVVEDHTRSCPELESLLINRPALMDYLISRVSVRLGADVNTEQSKSDNSFPHEKQEKEEKQPQHQFSPKEEAIINRLCALGFNEADVIRVYLQCNKDETAAANYLFENVGSK